MVAQFVDALGLVAGTFTTVSFFPQLVRSWRHGAEDLSYAMLFTFLIGVVLWLVYGCAVGALPVVVANAATAAQVLGIVAIKSVRAQACSSGRRP